MTQYFGDIAIEADVVAPVSSAGTKFGTSGTKLGFFNTTPVAQPSGNITTALSSLGLVSSPATLGITALPATGAVSGPTLTLTSAQTQAVGDAIKINSSGQAALAKADVIANATTVLLAAAAVTGSASNTYLMSGGTITMNTNPGWTVGGIVYLSLNGTTGNTLTQTAPSSAGNVIQVLGVALASATLLFMPSLTQIEHT